MRPAAVALLLLICCVTADASADGLLDKETYRPLVADQRAYRPGDNLTVLITETASASTTAKTTTNKKAALAGSANANGEPVSAGADLSEDFTGGGKIERTGRLLAQLTVMVQAVDRNGDLLVKGEQEILVNEEKQWISVEGRVRQADIRSDNTVLSNRISEARIKYTGKGLLAEKQKPGILTRFLSWLGIL